jgi:hypothetical protein
LFTVCFSGIEGLQPFDSAFLICNYAARPLNPPRGGLFQEFQSNSGWVGSGGRDGSVSMFCRNLTVAGPIRPIRTGKSLVIKQSVILPLANGRRGGYYLLSFRLKGESADAAKIEQQISHGACPEYSRGIRDDSMDSFRTGTNQAVIGQAAEWIN